MQFLFASRPDGRGPIMHAQLPLPCYAVRCGQGAAPQHQAACILPQSGIQVAPGEATPIIASLLCMAAPQSPQG